MATEQKIKFSQLGLITQFSGHEIVPMAYLNANYAAELSALKEYFADSSLQIFSRIVEGIVSIVNAAPDTSEGTIAIVFLPHHRCFALEKTVNGVSSYFSKFEGADNYMHEGTIEVRQDRVFFCVEDKQMYVYTNTMQNIFTSLRINAMSEEEFENLTDPIEGGFYATYEE